jgi:hypothetical protein
MDAARLRRIRGPNVGLARRWFLKREGEAGWQAFLATLSPECREVFSQPLGMYEWVEEAHYTEVCRAFLAHAQHHDAFRAGEVSAWQGLTTVNRWILKVLSPSFLISNLPRIWGFYVDGGALHIERLEPGLSQLSLYARGFVPEVFHPGLSGWIHAALTLTGARDLRIHYTPPDPDSGELEGCRHHFELTWRPED